MQRNIPPNNKKAGRCHRTAVCFFSLSQVKSPDTSLSFYGFDQVYGQNDGSALFIGKTVGPDAKDIGQKFR